jgi:CBS domain-containing protein
MGPNAFLPHFRTDAVPAPVAALGVTPAPIRPEPKSHRQARLVLLVLAPPGDAPAYLQIVAAFARALAQPEIVAALLAAQSSDEVLGNAALQDIVLEGPLLVRDIMTTRVYTVGPDTPLAEAAARLLRHNVEALPVVGSGGEVMGMISNGELLRYLVPSFVQRVNTGKSRALRKVAGKAVDPGQIPVREAMVRNVFCLSEDQTVAEAATLMTNKEMVRFPVVSDGVLTGFLTRADVVRKLVGSRDLAR